MTNPSTLIARMRQEADDLRYNRSGGDDYNWEAGRAKADWVDSWADEISTALGAQATEIERLRESMTRALLTQAREAWDESRAAALEEAAEVAESYSEKFIADMIRVLKDKQP